MVTFFCRFFHAFVRDEVAFTRWMRALMASVAMVVVTVLSAAGTDATAIVAEVRTWTWLDWAIRIGLGFLFSSVHSSSKPETAQGGQP
jgi:hypothetical protein